MHYVRQQIAASQLVGLLYILQEHLYCKLWIQLKKILHNKTAEVKVIFVSSSYVVLSVFVLTTFTINCNLQNQSQFVAEITKYFLCTVKNRVFLQHPLLCCCYCGCYYNTQEVLEGAALTCIGVLEVIIGESSHSCTLWVLLLHSKGILNTHACNALNKAADHSNI